MAGRAGGIRAENLDRVALALLVLIPPLFYVGGLGFYLDGWYFNAAMAGSADQSFTGLYRELAKEPALAVRPLQIVWCVLFYKLAPLQPLWPHLANQAVFASAIMVLYSALGRLRVFGSTAFVIVAVYACMPHFTAARFWFANQQSGLAVLSFACGLWLVARLFERPRGHPGIWLAGMALASAAGALSYGLFVLPALAAPAMIMLARAGGQARERMRVAVPATAASGVGLACAAAYKLSFGFGARLPVSAHDLARYPLRVGWLYARAALTSFWTLGIYFPRAIIGIAAGPYLSLAAVIAGALVAAVLLARARLAPAPDGEDSGALAPLPLIGAGGVIFVLGYGPFLLNFWYSGEPFGIANRANVAGALGVAMIAGGVLQALRRRWPAVATALFVAYCAAGVFVQVTVGLLWDRSAALQAQLLARFHAPIAALRPGDRLLVRGLCPYLGPGPVFAYGWDLSSRIDLLTHQPNIEAWLIPEVSTVEPGAIRIAYRDEAEARVPFERLTILDWKSGSVTKVANAAQGQAFFRAHPIAGSTGCRDAGVYGASLY